MDLSFHQTGPKVLFNLLQSRLLLYLALSIPAWPIIADLLERERYYAAMMSISGVMSVQLLVLSLAVTPMLILLRRLGRGQGLGRYLLKNRRHFGLISFYYAVLHLLHYMREQGWAWGEIALQGLDIELLTGWVGFFVLIVLAVTSNDRSVAVLGRRWKTLHLSVYAGTFAIYWHWFELEFFVQTPLLWAVLLIAIKAPQFWGAFRR